MLQISALILLPVVGGSMLLAAADRGDPSFIAAGAKVDAPAAAPSANSARTINVTPSTIASAIASAESGMTIRLGTASYGPITISRRQFGTPVIIDATGATVNGLVIDNSSGITVSGGTFRNSNTTSSYGIWIRISQNVRVAGAHITQAHRAVLIDRSSNVDIDSNRVTGVQSDGISIALSRNIIVRNNRCENFNPRPATYDANGQLLVDGDHPDCIQAWSRPTAAPTANITVTGNVAYGRMQGIFFGNHVRNGVNDGGFDNIVVTNNIMTVSYPNGIAISNVRGAVITGNTVSTVPGAVLPCNGRPVNAVLRFDGTNIRACGNRITSRPTMPGTQPCS